MLERADLEMFLSKLTVLCREHNVTFFVAESAHGPLSDPGVGSMPAAKKDWIYVALRSPFTPKDEWDSVQLVSQEALAEKRATVSEDEMCEADERYIRLLEAGLG